MKIILTGGTGFIGSVLKKELLNKGHELILLTRSWRSSQEAGVTYAHWEDGNAGYWQHFLEEADAVIHLAGESVAAKRWTAKQKALITESRVLSTRTIVEGIKACRRKPKLLVNASAVGYYGHVAEEDVTEERSFGAGFLAETCRHWEREAEQVKSAGVRLVIARFGLVLGKSGGALAKMKLPFQLGLGGPLGSGRQWVPWVHVEDAARMILFALENPSVEGALNAVSPHPVRMKEFCAEYAKSLHRPSWFPVPGFMLKLIFGEMSDVFLTGQKAVPAKLIRSGFQFKYDKLSPAFDSVRKA